MGSVSPAPGLPPEATTTTSFAWANASAALSAGRCRSPAFVLIETLMTSAPWEAAQRMPAAIRLVSGGNCTSRCPVVSSSWNTRTGRILTSGAAPMSAEPATGRAAMMPATAVPWPMKSSCADPGTNDVPGSTVPGGKCLLLSSTPESTTATTCPWPRDSGQDCGMLRLVMAYADCRTYLVTPGSHGGASALAGAGGEQRQRGDRQRDRQQRQPVSQPGHDWLAEVRAAAATVSDGPSANSSSHDGGTAAGCTPEKPSAVIACGTVPLDPIA